MVAVKGVSSITLWIRAIHVYTGFSIGISGEEYTISSYKVELGYKFLDWCISAEGWKLTN